MSENEPMKELRRHARFELLDYAFVRKPDRTDGHRAVIVDVSLGGFQTRSRHRFPADECLVVTVGQAGSTPVEVHVESRYSIAVEDTALFATGFKVKPKSDEQRIQWVNYVHAVFQSQGELLTR